MNNTVWMIERLNNHLTHSAFTIAYLLRILHSEDPPLAANLAYDAIQRALPTMQEVGFQSDLVSAPISVN